MADARKWITELAPPFNVGQAHDELIQRLQFAHDLLFSQSLPLKVPTSFLFDANGQLAAIYRGGITADRLRADLKSLQLGPSDRMVSALPFPGRWIDGRRRFAPVAIPADLANRGHHADALRYVQAQWKELVSQKEFPDFAGQFGNALAAGPQPKLGLNLLRQALQHSPNHVPLMHNLAFHLAKHRNRELRNGKEAVLWAERVVKATRGQVAIPLQTLAAAHAEMGDRPRALAAIEQAIRLTKDPASRRKLESLRETYRTATPSP